MSSTIIEGNTFQKLCPGAETNLPPWTWTALSTLMSMIWSWVVSRELGIVGRAKKGAKYVFYRVQGKELPPAEKKPLREMPEEQFVAVLLGRSRVIALQAISLGFDTYELFDLFYHLSSSNISGWAYYNCGAVIFATGRQVRLGLSLSVTFMGATLAAARKRERQQAALMRELEDPTTDEKASPLATHDSSAIEEDGIKLESGDSPFFLMAAYTAVVPLTLFFFLWRDRQRLQWPVLTFTILGLRTIAWGVWGLPLFFTHTFPGWIYTLFPLIFPLPAMMFMLVTTFLLKKKIVKYGSIWQHICYSVTAGVTLVAGLLLVATPLTAMVRM